MADNLRFVIEFTVDRALRKFEQTLRHLLGYLRLRTECAGMARGLYVPCLVFEQVFVILFYPVRQLFSTL